MRSQALSVKAVRKILIAIVSRRMLSTYGDPNSARLWKIAATELERAMESSAAEIVRGTTNAYVNLLRRSLNRGTMIAPKPSGTAFPFASAEVY
jgi:hypothetical protein